MKRPDLLNDVVRFVKSDPSELWKRMGKAMWSVQVLEFGIAHFIVANKRPLPTTQDELQRALGQEFRQTLGQLARTLGKVQNLPNGFEDDLSWLVDERNWLAHNIWLQNHNDIRRLDTFNRLLKRLESLDHRAMNLAKIIAGLMEKWAISRGISQKELDAEASRLYSKGKFP